MGDFSVFEYCYCDASNYKAFGSILLQGFASSSDLDVLASCFDASEFFIAEQLGIPPRYADLWELSGGPTEDDHVWHTFGTLRPASSEEVSAQAFDTVENFILKVKAIKVWNQKLSPHWEG